MLIVTLSIHVQRLSKVFGFWRFWLLLMPLMPSAHHGSSAQAHQQMRSHLKSRTPRITLSSKIKHGGLWRLYRKICWKQARYHKYVIIPTPSINHRFKFSFSRKAKHWIQSRRTIAELDATSKQRLLEMMAVCQRKDARFWQGGWYCVQNTWGKQALNCHIQENDPGTTAGTIAVYLTTHYIPTKSQNSRNYLHFHPGVTGSWQKLAKLEGGKRSARLNLSSRT